MSATLSALARRPQLWGLVCATLVAATTPASAQYGFGGYGGAGYGNFGGGGYGGFGGGYGGFGGFSAVGTNGYGGTFGSLGGSYAGFPLLGTINGYNAGYGNTLGLGLVPPAFVGTGTAGLGPVGIGGINPLFGLGLSPLAIHNAVAEQGLRQQTVRSPNSLRGSNSSTVRMNLYPPNTPTTPVLVPQPPAPNATPRIPR